MGALTRIASGGLIDGKSSGGNDDSGSPLAKVMKKIRGASKKGSSGSSDETGASSDYVPRSYHRGGKVRKTGLARLKKGERVLTRGQQKRLMKKRGGKSR